jgi:hypothetical protein
MRRLTVFAACVAALVFASPSFADWGDPGDIPDGYSNAWVDPEVQPPDNGPCADHGGVANISSTQIDTYLILHSIECGDGTIIEVEEEGILFDWTTNQGNGDDTSDQPSYDTSGYVPQADGIATDGCDDPSYC